MTFPAIPPRHSLYVVGAAALVVAVLLAWKEEPVPGVLATHAMVFLLELFFVNKPFHPGLYGDNPPLAARLSMMEWMTGTMNMATIPPP